MPSPYWLRTPLGPFPLSPAFVGMRFSEFAVPHGTHFPRSLGPGLPGGGRSGWTRTIDLGNNACVVSYPGARFCVPARIPDVSYPLRTLPAPSARLSPAQDSRGLHCRMALTSPDSWSRACPVVGLDGLEPSTSRLSGARSNHLSYRPFLIWFSSFVPSRQNLLGFFPSSFTIFPFPSRLSSEWDSRGLQYRIALASPDVGSGLCPMLLPAFVGTGFSGIAVPHGTRFPRCWVRACPMLLPAFVGTGFSGTEESHRALYPDHWVRACPVVEMMGFEPMTPCLQGRCSPS